jgi:hypothetical protein
VKGTVRESPRHRHGKRRTRLVRRRRLVVALVAGVVAIGFVVTFALLRGSGGVERVCSRPEDLRTRRGITLTAEAMEAFRRAEASVRIQIEVGESYRSCKAQALACERICGNRQGCPGQCAPPGLSWHQRGEAVDITQTMLDTPGVIEALEAEGWCQSVPDSDPGHFSFDGCH